MLKKGLLLTALFSAGFSLSDKYTELKELGPLPRYKVKSTHEKMKIDGLLSEKAWGEAPSITLMFPWDHQAGKKQKTVVKLLRDQEMLFVGYECEDGDITANFQNRDDPVYQDDCVEIFIKPSDQTDCYFGLEMNCLGVLFDYFYPFPSELDKNFNLDGFQLKTTLRGTLNKRDDHDQDWTLEVAIPFKNFSKLTKKVPPASGEQWRVQINRWDGVEDQSGRRLSMWCHSGLKEANPHNPERFGTIVFE